MKRDEFIELIGKDVVVDYEFCGELQRWSMKNFEYDANTDIIRHKRLPIIMNVFIPKANNPHIGTPTHG